MLRQACDVLAGAQALRGEETLSAAVLRNVFNGDESRKKDAAALARYAQW